MTTIVKDIIAESSVEESRDGLTATRVFVVQGVTGSEAARMANAIRDPGIPAYGDAHPNLPELQVVAKRATPHDMETFRVVVTYQQTDSLDVVGGRETIEIGSTVQSQQTARDSRGLLITKTYTVTDTDDEGNTTQRTEERVVEIEQEIALVTYIVRRREYENPAEKALFYTNSVSGNWRVSRIYGTSDDGGITFNVTYELLYNPQGWAQIIEDRDERGQIVLGSNPSYIQTFPDRGLPVVPQVSTIPEDAR